MTDITKKLKVRRGTLAEWQTANPILEIGEIGMITDEVNGYYFYVGDGVVAFNDYLGVPSNLFYSRKQFDNEFTALYDSITQVATDLNDYEISNDALVLAEVNSRQLEDQALQDQIDAEVTARADADAVLLALTKRNGVVGSYSAVAIPTGTTAESIAASIEIPANKWEAYGVISIPISIHKISGTGTLTGKLYLNNQNNLVGAVQFGSVASLSANLFTCDLKHLVMNGAGNGQAGYGQTGGTPFAIGGIGGTNTGSSFSNASSIFVIVTTQLSDSASTGTITTAVNLSNLIS